MEGGERQVSALELGRLADVLSVPIAHFVIKPPVSVTSYRVPLADDPDQNSRDRALLDIDLEGHARDAEWLHEQGFLRPAEAMTTGGVSDGEAAISLAQAARKFARIDSGPIIRLADTAEKFGLYLLVVDRDATGASLQLDPGFGVAVIGGRTPPGRRRWTAAHEVGHHIIGDAYRSDVGVAASDDQKEKIIDAFVGEFLLPRDELRANWMKDPPTEPFDGLIRLAATYRLSWSAIVAAATAARVIEKSDAQRLRARTPTRVDFLEIVGREPPQDLEVGATGASWKRAVLAAWRSGRVSAERAGELLYQELDAAEFPQREVTAQY